jgi:hypothetical protein
MWDRVWDGLYDRVMRWLMTRPTSQWYMRPVAPEWRVRESMDAVKAMMDRGRDA